MEDVTREDIIDGAGRTPSIERVTFMVLCAIFFSAALLLLLMRVIVRAFIRQKHTIDDGFLYFAAVSLVICTSLLYAGVDTWYLFDGVQNKPGLAIILNSSDTHNFIDYTYAALSFSWIAIYAVKGSFLAFFHVLVDRMSLLRKYYWGVVVFTALACVFSFAEPFIIGAVTNDQFFIYPNPSDSERYVTLLAIVTALDCITNLLILSIPLTLLRLSSLRLRQKLGFALFLSFSLLLFTFAIIRAAGGNRASRVDIIWQAFWQYIETATSVLGASLLGFRTAMSTTFKERIRPGREEGNRGREEEGEVKSASPMRQYDEEEAITALPSMRLRGRSMDRGERAGMYQNSNRSAPAVTSPVKKVAFEEPAVPYFPPPPSALLRPSVVPPYLPPPPPALPPPPTPTSPVSPSKSEPRTMKPLPPFPPMLGVWPTVVEGGRGERERDREKTYFPRGY